MNIAMENHNILVKIKQTLTELIPSKDSRTNISPLDFVVSLIFCYIRAVDFPFFLSSDNIILIR